MWCPHSEVSPLSKPQLAIVYVVVETEGFVKYPILSYPELSHCSLYHYNRFSTINFDIVLTSSVLKFYA